MPHFKSHLSNNIAVRYKSCRSKRYWTDWMIKVNREMFKSLQLYSSCLHPVESERYSFQNFIIYFYVGLDHIQLMKLELIIIF